MKIRARTLPFGEVKFQARLGERTRLHSHEFVTLGAVRGSGEARYRFGGESSLPLREGGVLLFPLRHPHRLERSAGAFEGYWMLHLRPGSLEPFPQTSPLFLDNAALHRRFLDLCETLLESSAANPLRSVEAFLPHLFERIPEHPLSLSGERSALEAVRRHLEAHVDAPFDLTELAERFGFGRSALSRRFKEAYGLSPRQYLINLRVHRVKRLLDEGWELARASLECGFYDQSHLYPYFRGIFGVSPAAYRRALRRSSPQ